MTKVAADAALDSLHPRFAVEAHLIHQFAPTAAGDAAGEAADVAASDRELSAATETAPQLARHLPEATVTALTEQAEQRHDCLAEGGRPNRAVVSGPYHRTADFRVSTPDPDALPLPLADGRATLPAASAPSFTPTAPMRALDRAAADARSPRHR